MKSHHLFLILVFFLASCTPSTPVPTATPLPTVTSTLTPIPTITPTATSTPEAWVAIAEKYYMPEEMARQLEGMDVSVEEDLPNVVNSVLVVNEETNEHMFFRDEHGNWVETDRYERSNGIEDTIKIAVPEEDLIDGTYLAWLNYLASQMDIDYKNIANVSPQISVSGHTQVASYPADAQEKLPDGKKIGIERELHFGHTIAACSADGVGECYSAGEDFVFHIKSLLNLDPDKKKASPVITADVCYSLERCLDNEDPVIQERYHNWRARGFYTPLTFDVGDMSGYAHALIQRSIAEMSEEVRDAAIQSFFNGNLDAFNVPGMVLGSK